MLKIKTYRLDQKVLALLILTNPTYYFETWSRVKLLTKKQWKLKSIHHNIKQIMSQDTLTQNQIKVSNTLFIIDQIFTGKIKYVKKNYEGVLDAIEEKEKSAKQPDTTDMSDLEREESTAERRNQQGQGLKILTPNQMLSRLPIFLAQLKAGNNSQKFKNEIRQLLHSLNRSKKVTKTICNHLINAI